MRLTLSEAQALLSRYAGAGNSFTDRINLVTERLIKAGNFKGTKQIVGFEVFSDVDGNPIVTLPRDMETILAGDVCGGPMRVNNGWYQFMPGGPGLSGVAGTLSFDEVPGGFLTFQDWTDSMLLRIRMETNEPAGVMLIKGTLLGEKIYSQTVNNGGSWIEGVQLAWNTNDMVATTTRHFDLPPYQIVKPVTNGRIALYVVDANDNETLVAIYDPKETSPGYRRYKVPRIPSIPVPTVFGPVTQFYTKSEIDALIGDDAPITVSSDSAFTLNPLNPFSRWFQKIIALDGVANYTASFALSKAHPKKGAIYRLAISIAQSAHPHIKIYDGSIGGTLLQEVDGDSSNTQFFFGEFEYDGSAWSLIGSGFLV